MIPKKDIFVKNGFRHFDGDYVWYSERPQWIFPVPTPNAVGALGSYANGIMLIKFGGNGKNTEIRIIAEDFIRRVYGNFVYRFSPNFSDDMIVYSQTRFAVIANLKTGEAFHANFNISTDDFMLGIRFLDPQNNLFVVAKAVDSGFNDPWIENLHIAKLDGEKLIDLGEVIPRVNLTRRPQSLSPGNKWIVHNRTLFVYSNDNRFDSKKMLCFDGLQKTTHPFADILNRNIDIIGNIGDIIDFTIHPELPFGLNVAENGHSLILIRWDTDELDKQFAFVHSKLPPLSYLLKINNESLTFTYLGFSPDGKWFVISFNRRHAEPYFVAIPVDGKHPGFLIWDELVILGNPGHKFTSLAWSTAPTAFVASDGDALYKWELGELRNARIIVIPEGDDCGEETEKRGSIFRRIGRLFIPGRERTKFVINPNCPLGIFPFFSECFLMDIISVTC
jgi:hypothetical protein